MASYVKEKLNVLRELGIAVSQDAKIHMGTLKSEVAIDNYAQDLIISGYEKYGY